MIELNLAGSGPRRVEIREAVVAGWTGRDPEAIRHHVEELAAIGVPRPSTTPLFYRVAADLLTQAGTIEIVGAGSSGEAEAVLIAGQDGLLVGLGSDHTDRDAEAYSVALSKQLCAKPLARDAWTYAEVAGHWDRLELRSWIEEGGRRVLYQEGTLAGLRHPDDLTARYRNGAGPLEPGTLMFCGTVPAKGGVRPSRRFEMELHDPVLGRSLSHAYEVRVLPVVA